MFGRQRVQRSGAVLEVPASAQEEIESGIAQALEDEIPAHEAEARRLTDSLADLREQRDGHMDRLRELTVAVARATEALRSVNHSIEVLRHALERIHEYPVAKADFPADGVQDARDAGDEWSPVGDEAGSSAHSAESGGSSDRDTPEDRG